ncbi:type II toxin-antitoxin system PemK/MazF family toxin [Limosilactobacillus caccae]|uniref:type II toxin-antitoxin system PemK/MazF family toxin n=1 Tax=Limosilactobacillus caccae TaxID=1926284 RepID=UPI0009710AF3|nr:type II toxin-antitoxin system PemK/MazF family toxin [Limosilactobacillus caccae]
MKINEIYTAYVSWGSDGKRRPVLVIEDTKRNVFCYKITSKFAQKSAKIKRNYFPLSDWRQEGLVKQSYVDIGNIFKLSKEKITFKFVGELSLKDMRALTRFIRERYNM